MIWRHVVLVGLSGCGKSTIGPRLARQLGLPFTDTDRNVVHRAGRTIDDIFASDGEAAFRQLERVAVSEAVAGQPSVIATGAGAPMDEGSRTLLWDGNAVVWLDVPVDVLVARLERTDRPGRERRPMLQGGGPAVRLPALLEARRPVYASAHVHVQVGGARPADVVATIWRQLHATLSRAGGGYGGGRGTP